MKFMLRPFREIEELEYRISRFKEQCLRQQERISRLNSELSVAKRNRKEEIEAATNYLEGKVLAAQKNDRASRKQVCELQEEIFLLKEAVRVTCQEIQASPQDSISDIWNEQLLKNNLPYIMDYTFRLQDEE